VTRLRAGAATDVGRVRQINEDRYLVVDGLWAVADGVGGHQAGEIASQTSIDALREHFTERTTLGLVEAVEAANRAVWQLAQQGSEKRGMGTTMTALALVDDGNGEQLAVTNVGDSRAYLYQAGELIQVTEDHSLVEELVREGRLTPAEAQVHPHRSIITRALGMESEIAVDSWNIEPYEGDRILLCSDGLTNEVSEERIEATLRQVADPQEAARDLVRQARANGGNDNITVVIVDVVDDDDKAMQVALGAAGTESRAPSPPADSGAENGTESGTDSGSGYADPWGRTDDSTISLTRTATATRTRPPAAPPPADLRPRRFTWRVVLFMALILTVLAAGAASVAWYARSAYFVGVTPTDEVGIYKGRPGGVLWFEPTLETRTGIFLADLPGARAEIVRAGKEEPNRRAAEQYVDGLRDEVARRATTTTTTAPDPADPTAPASPAGGVPTTRPATTGGPTTGGPTTTRSVP
jgi:protein phosphatase